MCIYLSVIYDCSMSLCMWLAARCFVLGFVFVFNIRPIKFGSENHIYLHIEKFIAKKNASEKFVKIQILPKISELKISHVQVGTLKGSNKPVPYTLYAPRCDKPNVSCCTTLPSCRPIMKLLSSGPLNHKTVTKSRITLCYLYSRGSRDPLYERPIMQAVEI